MQTSLLVIAVLAAAPAPKDAKKPAEPPSIVGEWSLETAMFMGMPLPKEAGTLKLEFTKDGALIATKDGKPEKGPGKYTHDPKKEPAEFDLEEGKNQKIAGIYKIEGETLTICMAPEGTRPTKFESSGMSIIMTFKRVKKD